MQSQKGTFVWVGAPAALRSDPSEPAGGGELQAEAMTVPFAGQGRAATPVADVDFLFSQNQSKLKALQVSAIPDACRGAAPVLVPASCSYMV